MRVKHWLLWVLLADEFILFYSSLDIVWNDSGILDFAAEMKRLHQTNVKGTKFEGPSFTDATESIDTRDTQLHQVI